MGVAREGREAGGGARHRGKVYLGQEIVES